MMRQFDTPGAVRLVARNAIGAISVVARSSATTEVQVRALDRRAEERAALTRIDCKEESGEYRVTVDVPAPEGRSWPGNHEVEVHVGVPEDAYLELMGASADLFAQGRFRGGKLQTASGDIEVDHASGDASAATVSGDVAVAQADGSLKIRTAKGDISVRLASGQLMLESESGDIEVGASEREARLHTASGDIQVGSLAGTLDAATASGDLTLREARGECRIASRSGDVEVESVREGKLDIETMSGDVQIGVSPGSRVSVDTETRTGDLRSRIPLAAEPAVDESDAASPLVSLKIRTMTGDVSIARSRRLSASVNR